MEGTLMKEVMEWVKSIIIAVILAIIIHSFLFAVVVVDGPSMQTTLHNGERLIMNKLIYKIHGPERGDILVFHATKEDDYIKRVIGLPGEKVQYINNQLFINDQPVDEPYLSNTYTNDFGPVTVPQGDIYVLGDNRNNSKDSRSIGPVAIHEVVGRVKILIWPLSRFSIVN